MKKIFAAAVACMSFLQFYGQANLKDSTVSAHIIAIDLGAGIPSGDLADRFGNHLLVGAGYYFKTQKNVLFGIDGDFIFGSTVYEDTILNNIESTPGYVIGTDGAQYSPALGEEAIGISLQAGKITNIFALNPNSGLAFVGGVGFLQHKISIFIDDTYVPQLSKEYRKGYDRMSNGVLLSQYIGYYVFSNRHFVNFCAGFVFEESFTKNRRSYNFDTQTADDALRFDMLISFKASWNLPIFEKPARKYYTH